MLPGMGAQGNPFEVAERLLAERAPTDLPTLALANTVSDTLGKVLRAFDLPDLDGEEPDDMWCQTKAVIYLGLLAGRGLRATMLLAGFGYGVEALAFKRRLVEVHARVKRVTDPVNGAQHARGWLRGQDKKASSVVELPEGAWHLYSHVVHADYRAAEGHLAHHREGDRVDFTLLPTRDLEKANAIVAMSAVETRDVAARIADFRGLRINGLDELDAELEAALTRWVRPADAGKR
jgi:hypothetical protein